MARNAVDNGTPASLTRASTHIYGSAETVDHYRESRKSEVGKEDGKTARNCSCFSPTTYHPINPITLVTSPTGLQL